MNLPAEWYEAQIKKHGSERKAAAANGIPRTTFHERHQASKSHHQPGSVLHTKHNDGRRKIEIQDGMVVVFSDGHFWPGEESTAFRALLKFIENYRPLAVINAGDAFDGATVSRWPVASWEDAAHQPTVIQEIEACQSALEQIEQAFPTERYWCLGNHDARFEMKLVSSAPQYAGLHGTRLRDYFPMWKPCWSVQINEDVIVKHRFRSGVHAGHTNTVNAGVTTVTGHTHQLEVKPFTDYRGTRYGVQTGTLSDLHGAKFGYAEDNPQNHRSGFVVLTFKDGRLLQPETVSVWDEDHVEFRGRVWRIE